MIYCTFGFCMDKSTEIKLPYFQFDNILSRVRLLYLFSHKKNTHLLNLLLFHTHSKMITYSHLTYLKKIRFTMNPNNQHFKDVFMGDVHLHTRMWAMWHYPFSIEPLSPIDRQPAQAILNAINRGLTLKSSQSST